jgi:hypothetical protein
LPHDFILKELLYFLAYAFFDVLDLVDANYRAIEWQV